MKKQRQMRRFDAKLRGLASTRRAGDTNCPYNDGWLEFAAGQLPEEKSLEYLEHAATCDACGFELKSAAALLSGEVTDEEEKLLALLTPQAIQNAKQWPFEPQKKNQVAGWGKFRGRLIAIAAGVILAAELTPWILQFSRYLRFKSIVEASYRQSRPVPYWVDGEPHGPFHSDRAKSPCNSDAQKGLPHPPPSTPPLLAAQAALFDLKCDTAIETLEKLHEPKKSSPDVLNNLAVAYALKGDYNKALEKIGSILKKSPGNSAALFNEAILFEQLGEPEKAAAALHQYIQSENDRQWSENDRQWLKEASDRLKDLKHQEEH